MKTVFGLFESDKYAELCLNYLGYNDFWQGYGSISCIRNVTEAMLDSQEIHFTFDGYDLKIANNFRYSMTSVELWMILHYDFILAKTTFHDAPKRIRNYKRYLHIDQETLQTVRNTMHDERLKRNL